MMEASRGQNDVSLLGLGLSLCESWLKFRWFLVEIWLSSWLILGCSLVGSWLVLGGILVEF